MPYNQVLTVERAFRSARCFRDAEEEEKHLELLLFPQVGLISLMSAGLSILVTVLGTTNWYICPLSERDRNLWFDSDQDSPRFL